MSKINNIKIRPVYFGGSGIDPNKTNTRAFDYFEKPLMSCVLLASTKCGKSTVLNQVIPKCVSKNTNVQIFSSTYAIDPVMMNLIDKLKKKGCSVLAKSNFIDEDSGMDYIHEFIMTEDQAAKDREEPEDEISLVEPDPIRSLFHVAEPAKKKKKKVKAFQNLLKKNTPRNILVIDDLSHMLRHPSIYNLLTKCRHFSCKVFISSHAITSMQPNAINQLDYCLIWKGQSPERIKELNNKLGINDERDTKKRPYLQDLYEQALDGSPYNFLYIDNKEIKFRKNFNQVIV